ncbi:restriction endonuclease subunit S [Sinomonas soli]
MTPTQVRDLVETGHDWLPRIPQSWAVVPAKALFKDRRELSADDDEHLTPSQKFGVVTQAEYMEITGTRVVLNLTGADNMKRVRPGDFIIHLRSFQGGIERSTIPGKVSLAYTVLTPRHGVFGPYFRWLLKSDRYIQALRVTVNQLRDGQSIRYQDFAKIHLPLPPAEEQRAIANYLDRETALIDDLIEKQTALIERLRERRSATVLTATERWGHVVFEPIRCRYLCDVGTGSGDTQDADEEGEFPFYVRSDTPLQSQTYEFEGPAVLTAGDGAGVGKVFHLVDGRFMAHQRVYVMRRFRRVTPKFFFYSFSARFAKAALDGSAKSTVDSVRRPMLIDLPLPIPPLDEQREIVDYLDREIAKIDALIDKVELHIGLAKERRSALITAAVTGQIYTGGA